MPKYYNCHKCQELISIGRSIEVVIADYEVLVSQSHVDVLEEVCAIYFCASCAYRTELSKVTHPDFEVRKTGWINCQKCDYESEKGDHIWAVNRMNGVVDDRGIQVHNADSLWVLCDKCGKDVDLKKIEVG